MTEEPENLPAFPVAACDDEGRHVFQEGMALRDYFAAAALQGMLGCPKTMVFGGRDVTQPSQYAAVSYAIANAMLAERAKA